MARENVPVPGCTVSRTLWSAEDGGLVCFSLAAGTDISAEIHPYHRLLRAEAGVLEVFAGDGKVWTLKEADCLLLPPGLPAGMRSGRGAVCTEISARRLSMNEIIKQGQVFRLRDLVPYQEGRIVNRDVMKSQHMKLAVMSFDRGTALSEHAAPGDALLLALDGQAIVRYEGVDHLLHSGESFRFAKGGLHAVRAQEPFKMALLLAFNDV